MLRSQGDIHSDVVRALIDPIRRKMKPMNNSTHSDPAERSELCPQFEEEIGV